MWLDEGRGVVVAARWWDPDPTLTRLRAETWRQLSHVPITQLWGTGTVGINEGRGTALLWEFEGSEEAVHDFEQLGQSVRQLHASPLAAIPRGLPVRDGDGLNDLADRIERLHPAARQILVPALAEIRRRLLAASPSPGTQLSLIHGDLHLGNVLWSGRGPVLCDIDEIAIADPRYDLAFVLDTTRRNGVDDEGRTRFLRGYGSNLQDSEGRWWALASHIRRTVVQEEIARTRREKSWVLARRSAWQALLSDWDSLDIPLVERPRVRQAWHHLRGFLGAWR